MRLFTAIELPEDVRQHLAAIARQWRAIDDELGGRISWVPPQNYHVTLKFFGEVADTEVAGLCEALKAIAPVGPAKIRAEAVECFPPRRSLRVAAFGLGGDVGNLVRLNQAIEIAAEPRGFARERRPFRAHITVARSKVPLRPSARDRLERTAAGLLPGPEFAAREFVVMQSILTQSGAEYVPVGRVPLGEV
ncbi:MAG TPA: RNA 2',3'-cyclic phosphodiesterase [Humisphaera sp.]|jgi:2'-5' RNA ligase|nr:RNA 2',3'-cyclic phosphodiesterase [Humisphaera sp.]